MCSPHVPGVLREPGLALLVRHVRRERLQVRGEGRLRVDHDPLPTGEPHDHVGSQHATVPVGRRRLFDEVAVLHHPRHLDDATELDLAPAAADVRRTERGDEIGRLAAEPQLLLAQVAHSFGQRSVRLLAGALERVDLGFDLAERLAQRRDVGVELRLREVEECPGALLHRRRRGAVDRASSRARRVSRALPRSSASASMLRLSRARASASTTARRAAAPDASAKAIAHSERDGERADGETDGETDDQGCDRHEGDGP